MTNNTAIIQKLNPLYWEQFQITKMGINTVDDLHLEIIIKNKGKNIVQSYKAIFCVKERGLFDQDEETLRDIHLIKKNVHEYKSSRRTKFFFEIDKEDLVWMFQHIDFIETPGVGICLIPCDKETVKAEEVVVHAVAAPEVEVETVAEIPVQDVAESVIADAIEDEVITEEEAEQALETEEKAIEQTVHDDAVDAIKYAVSQSPIAKQEPIKTPFEDDDLPF